MKFCEYGCGEKAKYQLKNGKWCCSKSYNSCPFYRKKKSKSMKKIWKNSYSRKKELSIRMKKAQKDPNSKYNSISCREKMSNNIKDAWEDPNSKYNSDLYKENLSNGMKKSHKDPTSVYNSILFREKQSKIMKEVWKNPNSGFNLTTRKNLTIEKINKKYPTFYKVEEMRYNPDKPNEKEIQVHCKNHECENSKEKGGWFTPKYEQLRARFNSLDTKEGNDGHYLYCCQECKDTCPLYNLHGDPYKNNNLPYTYAEYKVCRSIVFERENTLCEYCGEPATHMHHIFPVKLEPFFALDPDYCVACCEEHHYKYAHKDECSTGNLAKIVCSVESQKFLEQKFNT